MRVGIKFFKGPLKVGGDLVGGPFRFFTLSARYRPNIADKLMTKFLNHLRDMHKKPGEERCNLGLEKIDSQVFRPNYIIESIRQP